MQEQEETKSHTPMKISIQPNSNSFIKANQNRSWSFKNLFFCCQPQTQGQSPEQKRQNKSSITSNHYSSGEPNSFITFGKDKTNNDRTRHTIELNTDIFLLGKGKQRIMCRSIKTNLSTKSSPFKIDNKSGELKTSKAGFDTNDSANPKKSMTDLEITVGSDLTHQFTRHEIFSLYSQGIRVEKSDWNEITPECIAQHIARRLGGYFVLDALSGYGGNAIQFAKYCPFVIGVEIESHKIKKSEHNAGIYKVTHNIDFIQGDFFSLKKLYADVVFLAPSELRFEKNEKFSIHTHFSPNLSQLIQHSLTLANSLCILLPAHANVEELAAIFCDIFNKNPIKYSHLNYAIEIEPLYLEDLLISTVVMFGEISSINNEEKRELLLQLIDKTNEKCKWQTVYSEKFINRVFKQVGLHRSLTILGELEESNSKSGHPIFEAFLEYIKNKKIISNEQLKQLQESDLDSQMQSMTQPSTQIHKLLQPWSVPEGTGHSENLHEKEISGTINRSPSNKKMMADFSHPNSNKTEGMREALNHGESYNQVKHTPHEHIENSPGKSAGSPMNQEDEGKDQYPKSFETSDMAVSSYSMKSDAMLDSFSDTEAQYTLAVEDEEQEKDRSKSITSIDGKSSPMKKNGNPKMRKSGDANEEK